MINKEPTFTHFSELNKIDIGPSIHTYFIFFDIDSGQDASEHKMYPKNWGQESSQWLPNNKSDFYRWVKETK